MVKPTGRNHTPGRLNGGDPTPSRFDRLNHGRSSTSIPGSSGKMIDPRTGRPVRGIPMDDGDGAPDRVATRPSVRATIATADDPAGGSPAIRDSLSAFEDSSIKQKSVYSYNTGHMSGPNGVRSVDDVRRKVIRPDDTTGSRRLTESPSKIILAIIAVVIVLAILKVLFF